MHKYIKQHNMKWNRTSRQYYNEKYERNQAVRTIGKDALKTEVNKPNRGKGLGYRGLSGQGLQGG